MKEVDLAQHFVNYLSDFDLYFEVDYGGQVDIVAIAGCYSMAVEVKTAFNFKVLEQALHNKQRFNYSYIAVPSFRDGWIQHQLCKDYGLGLLLYDPEHWKTPVWEYVQPKLNRHVPPLSHLKARLHDYNKRSAPGSPSGGSGKVTAFRVTVENSVAYVRRHPGCSLRELSENVAHHYGNNKAAASNIYAWIHKGVIKELRYERGKLYLPHKWTRTAV